MTPFHLTILIHAYTSGVNTARPYVRSEVSDDYEQQLMEHGYILKSPDNGLRTTLHGNRMVDKLCTILEIGDTSI